jgi:ATP-dependent Lon protease
LELVLSHDNKRDFDELSDYLREGISVHFSRSYREVFYYVLHEHRLEKFLY